MHVVQVGLERLTLPAVTLAATVGRMSAERETVAAQRTADGNREAAQIRSDADRDARLAVADANVKAAEIEAQSRKDAAAIYGNTYAGNPRLYTMLRSLDTLDTVVSANTNLILRTDAAPFQALVQGPTDLKPEPSGTGRRGRRAGGEKNQVHAMSTDANLPPLGPGAQAVRLSFWFVVVVAVLAACAWAGSNIRRIPPDSRAVVLRFGAFVRTQDAGLLVAWPRPFETTLLVPGSARVLEQRISRSNVIRARVKPTPMCRNHRHSRRDRRMPRP